MVIDLCPNIRGNIGHINTKGLSALTTDSDLTGSITSALIVDPDQTGSTALGGGFEPVWAHYVYTCMHTST